ncbi:MAG: hypothetical protein ACOYEV_09600 [Candidatus Nanopelagicales bacterium]
MNPRWLLLAAAPLAFVMVIAYEDIWTRSGLTQRWRIAWTVACTIFWPALLLYFGMHPLVPKRRRRVIAGEQDDGDRRTALVNTVIAHDEGRLSDSAFATKLAELRPPYSG